MQATSLVQAPSAAPLARLPLAPANSTPRGYGIKPAAPYDAFVKLALRTRLRRVYLLQLLATHLLFSTVLMTSSASLLAPLRPWIMLTSVAVFALAILPLLVLSKWSVSASSALPAAPTSLLGVPIARGSPAAHALQCLKLRKSWARIALHTSSGALLAAAHNLARYVYASDKASARNWALFRVIQVNDVARMRPNETVFVIVGLNALLGFAYAVATVVAPRRQAPVFDSQASNLSLGARLGQVLNQRLSVAVALGAALPPTLFTLYYPFRRPIFRAVLRILGPGFWFRALIVPSFRAPLLSPYIIMHSAVLGMASCAAWVLADTLWEVYATQPVPVSIFAREPTRCLISGLAARRTATTATPSSDAQGYYAHFAFAELALLAASSEERRRAIWRDVGDPSAPLDSPSRKSAWAAIASECLAVLNEETASVARKGAPAPAAKPTPGATPAAGLKGLPPATINPGRKPIVKPATTSVWDRLLSSGSPAQPQQQQQQRQGGPKAPAAPDTSMRALFRRLNPQPPPPPAPQGQRRPNVQVVPSVLSVVLNIVGQLFTAFFAVLRTLYSFAPAAVRSKTDRFLPSPNAASVKALTTSTPTFLLATQIPANPALVAWACVAAASLLAASVGEDTYGTVALSSRAAVHFGGDKPLGVDAFMSACAALLLELKRFKGDAVRAAMKADEQAAKVTAGPQPKTQGQGQQGGKGGGGGGGQRQGGGQQGGKSGGGGQQGGKGKGRETSTQPAPQQKQKQASESPTASPNITVTSSFSPPAEEPPRPKQAQLEAFQLAWQENAAPLVETLKRGILHITGAFEEREMGLSLETAGLVEEAMKEEFV